VPSEWMDLAYIVDLVLLDTGILEDLLDGLHCLSEKIHVEFLKLGSGQGLPYQLKSSSAL
jgi:hypothetical protein